MKHDVFVRPTTHEDFPGIIALCKRVYPTSTPWSEEALASHLSVFPEGQIVAIDRPSGEVVGMAASLIVRWDDYDPHASWREFTDRGRFTNHDPEHGRTLYGAEVMVDPSLQGHGIGTKLYTARREIVERLGLLRIRAGARLRGYGKYADTMTPEEYVLKVVLGDIHGPTLSFQLKNGFHVIDVTSGYLKEDPDSRGYAAIIEWVNPKAVQPADQLDRPDRFRART